MQGKELNCEACGYTARFSWGIGMLGPIEECEKEKHLEKEFEQEILDAKYGSEIKAYYELMGESAHLCRDETLFQCLKCCKLMVYRRKSIIMGYSSTREYSQETIFFQTCPECGSSSFYKADLFPICPNCKRDYLKTKRMWRD